ncbi:scoloptoxin SSD14-like isoform X2 [Homalodisca vitripennis]|uniref:scoloptoxin SSD14-like isoform X2 n=1 Tax=Homalodisca vitripennis TaxID=197043 RepID=UPI001EECA5F1|nr:scoloptoxin SSD14-like isoform X2 [Homalodisca vitripennis]
MNLPRDRRETYSYTLLTANEVGPRLEFSRRKRSGLRKRYVLVSCAAILVVSAATALLTWQLAAYHQPLPPLLREPPDPEDHQPPSPSYQHVFRRAAVCTDGTPCSRIGRDILAKNGSAVDAAVAALFCNGVVNMQSMGLGGGFIMTLYERATRTGHSLVARETAPGSATKNMFDRNSTLSRDGALAAGVPGELRGYWEAHKRFGKLPWAEVVEPTLQICRDGYHMSKHQSDVLSIRSYLITRDPNLREWFFNKVTGQMNPAGSLVRPRRLCATLEVIAREGGEAIHNGSLTQTFAEDIQALGGIITEADLRKFRPLWRDPITVRLHGNTLYTSPPPGSGAFLAFILNILDGFNMTQHSMDTLANMTVTTHRMVEAFKYAYARRTEIGDPDFVNITQYLKNLMSDEYANDIRAKILDNETSEQPEHYGAVYYNQEDSGTAHISILAPNGDAVSVTSTVNLYFGGGVTSERLGIILNSGMDDFSVPGVVNYYGVYPSPSNFIVPGKRAMSSVSPTIIVNSDGDVTMVIGASGGTKIITSVSSVIMRYLWLGNSIKEAVDASRVHHQLYPMEVSYEYGVIAPLIRSLQAIGHKTKRYRDRGSIVCALARQDDKIYANADYRKGGEVYGMD